MATRLYPIIAGATAWVRNNASFWEYMTNSNAFQPGNAFMGQLAAAKAGTTVAAAVASSETTATADVDVYNGSFVSAPLDVDQTISGTIQGQMLVLESSTLADMHTQVVVYVYSGDMKTLRGTLYAGDQRTGNVDEMTAALRNQRIPAASATNATSGVATLDTVNALAGDRIVVEIGARSANVSTTSYTVRYSAGGTGTDLTAGGTETTGAGWFEFSQNITFDTSTKYLLTNHNEGTTLAKVASFNSSQASLANYYGGPVATGGALAGGTAPNAAVFSTAQAFKGTQSVAVQQTSSSNNIFGWTIPATDARQYGRVYIYATALESGSINTLVSFATSAVAFRARIALNASGKICVVNTAGTTIATMSGTMALNQWIRLEWDMTISGTVGQATVKYYSDPYSPTATETINTAATQNFSAPASGDIVAFGLTTATTTSGPIYFDEPSISNFTIAAPVETRLSGACTGTSSASGTLTKTSGGGVTNLSGSSTGTSSAAATPTRSRAEVGASTGTSASTATPTRKRAETGASTGTSASTAAPTRKRTEAGSSSGSSSDTGLGTRSRALSGSTSGSSSATGTPGRTKSLSGSATGTSSAVNSAGPLRTRKEVGSSAGSSAASGTLSRTKSLSGSATGTSSATGTPQNVRKLSGSATGTSAATASDTRSRSLSGASTGTSSASGTITTNVFTGSSTGTSSASGTITRKRAESGSATGVSTASGTPSETHLLSGSATGTSSASGTISRSRTEAGSSSGSSSDSANNKRTRALSGSATGTSSASGSITKSKQLSGSATGTSSTTANVIRTRKLSGVTSGTSSAIGDPDVISHLSGSATGTSSVSGTAKRRISMSGSASGTSLVTGTPSRKSKLSGIASGTSSVTATPIRLRKFSGSSTGTSFVTQAHIGREMLFEGSSEGYSDAIAHLGKLRDIVSKTGKTHVSGDSGRNMISGSSGSTSDKPVYNHTSGSSGRTGVRAP